DGSLCPLQDVVEIAGRYDCVMVVDESHSLGVLGPRGAGLVVALGLTDKIHFRTASLAKAFVGRAGIITCSNRFSLYFRSTSLPMIFSSALLLHEIAALQKTLEIIAAADERRAALRRNAALLREGLNALGYNVEASRSQIIALEAGSEQQTIKLRDSLEERNVFGAVFCAPATAKNRSLIRLSTQSSLTTEQIHRILEVCSEIRELVELDNWPSTRRKKNIGLT
ncbi:MAG: aminotransferase class I/II-fold pyridoxal phosphate-dependent enzyme, partial [Gammaproteobacteria bacterium]